MKTSAIIWVPANPELYSAECGISNIMNVIRNTFIGQRIYQINLSELRRIEAELLVNKYFSGERLSRATIQACIDKNMISYDPDSNSIYVIICRSKHLEPIRNLCKIDPEFDTMSYTLNPRKSTIEGYAEVLAKFQFSINKNNIANRQAQKACETPPAATPAEKCTVKVMYLKDTSALRFDNFATAFSKKHPEVCVVITQKPEPGRLFEFFKNLDDFAESIGGFTTTFAENFLLVVYVDDYVLENVEALQRMGISKPDYIVTFAGGVQHLDAFTDAVYDKLFTSKSTKSTGHAIDIDKALTTAINTASDLVAACRPYVTAAKDAANTARNEVVENIQGNADAAELVKKIKSMINSFHGSSTPEPAPEEKPEAPQPEKSSTEPYDANKVFMDLIDASPRKEAIDRIQATFGVLARLSPDRSEYFTEVSKAFDRNLDNATPLSVILDKSYTEASDKRLQDLLNNK